MAKTRIQFLCNSCGSVHPKWLGKCPDCGTWDSLEEYKAPTEDQHRKPGPSGPGSATGDLSHGATPLPLTEIDTEDAPRTPTGISEFDRVLGGGIVPGSAILVGGEPGIGKSTLLLQVANNLAIQGSEVEVQGSANSNAQKKKSSPLNPEPKTPNPILYITSEESARQTKLRASRLGIESPNLLVLAETNVERILNQIHKTSPAVVVIDSIQMIYKPDIPAAPGSVTQLRDCCMDLVYLAKSSGIAVIFVGHVTKAGTLAGPKIIEHIVDTVVYFEGDRFHSHRIVRCVKNRFGSTHEVGLFEMTGEGLREVTDPGNLFLEQYGPGGQPSGSVITAAMQGSRVLLVEVQALTASSVIGAARRKVSGVSSDRVGMIIAVLEKRAELRLAADDVFVNIAGGVKIIEPAVDLAIALAIASAHTNRPLPPGALAIGELGLGGEIRSVPQLETRLREASRLGLGHAIVPHMGNHIPKLGGMALHEARRLSQALAEI
ncbi:MAG TPA: DNA repair protein RadA [Tepidisphaeraceae bacterium]|nr:DNA repair protein RadA [Tepidisphaeraceae bacterium]